MFSGKNSLERAVLALESEAIEMTTEIIQRNGVMLVLYLLSQLISRFSLIKDYRAKHTFSR